MSEDNFFLTGDEPVTPPKKKPARKRATPAKKPSKAALPAGGVFVEDRPVRRSKSAAEDPRVNEFLTNIYKDDNGKLPDMRRIAVKKNGSWLKAFTSFVVVAALLVAAGWYGYFWLVSSRTSTSGAIHIALSGPTSLMLGATSTYTIDVENIADVPVNNATLQLFYPTGFVYGASSLPPTNAGHNEWTLATIAPHSKASLTVSGQPFGMVDSVASWRAFVSYQPQNVASPLQESATLSVHIDSSPFELSVAGPSGVTPGAATTFTFTLKSTGSWQPAKIYLTPTLPEGFAITNASPSLDSNKRWVITAASSTTSTAQRTFTLQGILTKSVEASVPVSAALTLPMGANGQLYDLAKTAIQPTVFKNGVAFNMAVNGQVDDGSTYPGDTLAITLSTKNTGVGELKNAKVQLVLEAPSDKNKSILDWANITDKNDGTVTGDQITPTVRRGTIVWGGKEISALSKLKANDEVQIDVALPLKDAEHFDLTKVGPSSTIRITPTLTYTDSSSTAKTVAGNPITLSFNSDTKLEVRDSVNGTNHSISWVLTNSLHTLKNITITAPLFGDITYATPSTTDGGTLDFDSAKKVLTWRIEAMPDSVDVLTAPFMVTLNKVDKSQSILMGKAHLTATDAVTGNTIDIQKDEISLK